MTAVRRGRPWLASLALVLALLVLLPDAGAGSAVAPEEAVGGRSFYACAAFQTIKFWGLFTANVPLVVAGAIGGGLACGMGW